ncbi:MAG TPA: lipopolysaccharide biosynthesis protein [Polyangiaceae bacterium]|nr:lipopolysaccharide biosynthesis protein [Polyangiaceae bacterium]
MGLGKAAARALVWTSLESFALSGLSLVSLFVFARLLSAEEFGLAAVSLAIIQVLTVPVELLFHDALIQRSELEPAHVNSAFTVSVGLGVSLCAACWLCADGVEALLREPQLGSVLRWMSLSLVGSGFGSVVAAMQRRKLEFRSLALRSMIGRAGSAVIAITLALFGAGLWSLVVQQVLLVCLASLMLWLLADERPRFYFRWRPTRELLGFGLFVTFCQLLLVFIPRIFMVLVGGYLGTASAGLLSLAFRGLDMLRDLLASAVGQVAMPLFARLRDSAEALFDAYNRSVQLTALVSYPLFVGLAVCADEVVAVAFGPQWSAAAPYFAVVALLALDTFTRMYSLPLLQAFGRPGAPIIGLVVEAVYIALGMTLYGRDSTAHAMAVWASRVLICAPVEMWVQRQATNMSLGRQLRGAGKPLVAAVVMGCAVRAIAQLLPAAWPPAIRLVPMVLTGAVIYVATVGLLDRALIAQLLRFVGQSTESSTSS